MSDPLSTPNADSNPRMPWPMRLLRDRGWPFALVRIGVLVGLGWLAIQAWLPGYPEPGDLQRLWPETDFSRHTVPLGEIEPGGPPRDGIPAIDSPRFVAVDAVDWLADDAPVIAVEVDRQARAYPLEILIWHEIVNDVVAGQPVLVTFCPLCNASLVFRREVDGRMLEFGTTGWLRMSDLVMYDRQTFSFWQQLSGEAIVGTLSGARLTELPSAIISFGDFREAHPAGQVLSRDTGHWRRYGHNPYPGYDRIDDNPLLAVAGGLAPMQRVLAIRGEGWQRIYPLRLFRDRDLIQEQVHDVPVLVIGGRQVRSALDAGAIDQGRHVPTAIAFDRRVDGEVLDFVFDGQTLRDRQTGSRWSRLGRAEQGPLADRALTPLPGGVHFAFAWLAFHPDSTIFAAADQPVAPDG